MNRRVFLTTTAAGAATFAFPAVLRAQSKDPIRVLLQDRTAAPARFWFT